MCIYIYIYTYMHTCIHTYIYIYIYTSAGRGISVLGDCGRLLGAEGASGGAPAIYIYRERERYIICT